MARLIVESGEGKREIVVAGAVTIGRLKSCTIPFEDKTISREHARVRSDGVRYVVEDLGSKSGTFVNGKRIQNTETLSHGDTIKIGPLTIRLQLDAAELPKTAPVPQPARARARTSDEVEARKPMSSAVAFFLYLFLLGVLGAVTYASKVGFGILLDKVLA